MLIPDNINAGHQWQEPWFFVLRSSSRRAWILRIAFFIGNYVLFVVLMSIDTKSPAGPEFGLAATIILPALIAGVFLTLIEAPAFQRTVTLTDRNISAIGTFMRFGGPIQLLLNNGQWNRKEIKDIRIIRPGESENSFRFAVLVITRRHSGGGRVGIPQSVSLNEVADHLHSMGLAVQLSEWLPPSESDTSTTNTET